MIQCDNIERKFRAPGGEVAALDGVSLSISRGEFVVIHGPSGCGKSTLLLVMGGMQRPGSGRVVLNGTDLYALSGSARNRLRSTTVGFVFQLFHLIPYLTVRENILAGLPVSGETASLAAKVDELIARLGLASRSASRPGTLSAGERQRVAMARALIKRPALILADEPTGNLDPENAAEVFRHLAEYQKAGGTVVVVTHGGDAARHAGKTIHMKAGRIVQPIEISHS